MQISIVRPGDLGLDDIAAWRAMQRCTPALANPFLSLEFAIAAALFRPEARVGVLTDGASTVGFFPFERRRLGVGVPIAPGLTDCQGLVHAPGAEWDVRELLWRISMPAGCSSRPPTKRQPRSVTFTSSASAHRRPGTAQRT
jgi:CelD/BcsL family acetyltransferase involved in cellulose biosynthesis